MSPKLIKKLADKKYRNETGLFLVEGEKSIDELLASDFEIVEIIGTDSFLDSINESLHGYEARTLRGVNVTSVSESALAQIGTKETNNAGVAVAKQRTTDSWGDVELATTKDFVLALDNVRDPGNLGTIIRIADWFGVRHVVASLETTDFYNPKTVSASMGSFTRVEVTYTELAPFLKKSKSEGIPIMGADISGKNMHDMKLPRSGILLMGSESHGIHADLSPFVTQKIAIPKFGGAESLNVSVATGIILDALRRQN